MYSGAKNGQVNTKTEIRFQKGPRGDQRIQGEGHGTYLTLHTSFQAGLRYLELPQKRDVPIIQYQIQVNQKERYLGHRVNNVQIENSQEDTKKRTGLFRRTRSLRS